MSQVVLPQGFAMPQQPYAVAQPGFHAGVPFAQAGRPIHQQQWVHAAPPGAPPDDFMVGTEKAIRKDYDPETREWKRSAIVVRVAKQPFSSGSMRHAFKMEDLTLGEGPHTEFVAKMSKDPRESRQVYFDDVQMQMEAKGWADRFNERFGRKVVDFLVAYVAELVERPGRPVVPTPMQRSWTLSTWQTPQTFLSMPEAGPDLHPAACAVARGAERGMEAGHRGREDGPR
jgi:hypothetical protein